MEIWDQIDGDEGVERDGAHSLRDTDGRVDRALAPSPTERYRLALEALAQSVASRYNSRAVDRMNKRKKLTYWALFVVVVTSAGFWWNEYRTEPIHDLVNPMYWVRRWRQEDLYDANTRVLRHGNRNLKEIALTIDDGPHSQTGDQLLDVFKKYKVPVTFFVVGSRIEERPDLVQRMLAEGHEVANHSQNHFRLDTLQPKQMWREINDCDIHFCRITGRHFSLLRPPGMRFNDAVLKTTKELDYVVVSWSDAAKDFMDVSPEFIVNRVLRRAENGSIILLHDDRPSTVSAMPRILSALQRDGYKFVTVSEMLSHLPKPVVVQTNANRPTS